MLTRPIDLEDVVEAIMEHERVDVWNDFDPEDYGLTATDKAEIAERMRRARAAFEQELRTPSGATYELIEITETGEESSVAQITEPHPISQAAHLAVRHGEGDYILVPDGEPTAIAEILVVLTSISPSPPPAVKVVTTPSAWTPWAKLMAERTGRTVES